MRVADNADRELTVETEACQRWPLNHVAGDRDEPEWLDARVSEPITTPIGRKIIAEGVPVEVKSCRRQYRERAGRWWIRRESHERLLAAGGEYVLAVLDHSTGDVERMALTGAVTVDALIPTWWACGDGGRTAEEYRQVPWTAVFDRLRGGHGGE